MLLIQVSFKAPYSLLPYMNTQLISHIWGIPEILPKIPEEFW